MLPLVLAASVALAAELPDLRADFLAGKTLPGDSVAGQVQKGRYDLLEQVAREWKLTPEERGIAEELYRPKYQLMGAGQPQNIAGGAMNETASKAAMGRAGDIASRLRWDRSAGSMPSGAPSATAQAGASGGYRPDYRSLNAQSRGGPTTVKINEVPGTRTDVDRFQTAFEASVARMDREGLRRSGSGEFNGFMNNMSAALMPGSKKVRCFDQAEQLVGDLEKAGFDRKKWTFRIRSYTGDGHEANGHYWVEAVSKDPKEPTVVMDPWKNSIKTIDQKEEVVIKPYSAYWMGWAMDKIGL